MTVDFLVAALLAHGAQCTPSACQNLAADILAASSTHRVSPLLMAAVAIHESRGKHVLSRRAYGYDVGAWQIRCPTVSKPTHPSSALRRCLRRFWGRQVEHLRRGPTRRAARRQAFVAAKILTRGISDCRSGRKTWWCRDERPWARYNPGSRRWALSVGNLLEKLILWVHRRTM